MHRYLIQFLAIFPLKLRPDSISLELDFPISGPEAVNEIEKTIYQVLRESQNGDGTPMIPADLEFSITVLGWTKYEPDQQAFDPISGSLQ